MNKKRNSTKRLNKQEKRTLPKGLRRRTEYRPLVEAELANLLDVLRGELKEVALLALLTRRSPRELMTWKQGDVVPLIEQLAQEFQGLSPAAPNTLLFPGLAKIPGWLLDEKTSAPPESVRAMSRNILASLASTAVGIQK